MTIRLFAKRWLLFSIVSMLTLLVAQHFKHRPITGEDLICFLLISFGWAAIPTKSEAFKRLGFRVGQRLREYRRRNAES